MAVSIFLSGGRYRDEGMEGEEDRGREGGREKMLKEMVCVWGQIKGNDVYNPGHYWLFEREGFMASLSLIPIGGPHGYPLFGKSFFWRSSVIDDI